MIDQGLGLKVSPYDDLLAPLIVTQNTKWNDTFVFFHYTWWRSAPDDCSQWHNSYVTNTFSPPPSNFIKMTLIFICVNITINKLFSFYWPKTCISGLIIFSHEWEWLFKTECYCTLLIKYIWNYWHLNPCLCYYCVVSISTNSLSFSEYYECLSLFEVKLRF